LQQLDRNIPYSLPVRQLAKQRFGKIFEQGCEALTMQRKEKNPRHLIFDVPFSAVFLCALCTSAVS
jgi:hypothetical protein